MIRIHVRLTDEQVQSLKRLAAKRGCPVAELIREGVDYVLEAEAGPTREKLRARAVAASGKYRSGVSDVSRRHDDYLAEDFGG